mgnify:CR=1 FL=1
MSRLADSQKMDDYFLNLALNPADSDALNQWGGAVNEMRAKCPNQMFILVLSPPRAQVRKHQTDRPRFIRDEQFREFCKSNRIPLIDLLPALAGHEIDRTYVDPLHYSEEGHAIVASEIRRRLDQLNGPNDGS